MSNELNALLARVEKQMDDTTARDLRRHIEVLKSRREFGLNFERHMPESVDLIGRPISVGDKVRFIPPRGETTAESDATWLVTGISVTNAQRIAVLLDPRTKEESSRPLDDLVYVADFRDPIYPGLKRSSDPVLRGGDKPFHTVINAENYHALEALLFAHQGKVDCIYIDPPYNTGARDWKYNNDYVDSQDAYRHSKWLAFMERRLKVAKKLLNPRDSVLIVTIDEKEINRLSLLLEQTFRGAEIQTICTIINPQGISSGPGEFSRVHEYVLFVYIGDAALTQWSRSMVDNEKEASDVSDDRSVRWADFARYGAKASRQFSPGAFFPIFVDIESETVHSVGDALAENEKRDDVEVPEGTRAVWPPNRPDGGDGRWRVTAESCRELVASGYLRVGPYNKRSDRHSFAYLQDGAIRKIASGEIVVTGRDGKGSVTVEYAENTKTATPKTIWTLPSHDASRHGSNLLRQFLPGRSFPFPKSLYAVEDALRFFVAGKKEATVVDFFSGSGTTAHAVMRLNKQDNGRRTSICVTNNEVSAGEQAALRKKGFRPGDPDWEALGICDYITKPRLRAAVTGETPDGDPVEGDYRFTDEFPMSDGFEENVEFFTLTYENPALVELDLAFERIAPLLWMRAGAAGRRIEERNGTFDVADTYGVLFNVDASKDFLAALDKADGLQVAYIVTDDETQFQAVAGQLPDGVGAVRLYETYLRTFQINTGRH